MVVHVEAHLERAAHGIELAAELGTIEARRPVQKPVQLGELSVGLRDESQVELSTYASCKIELKRAKT